MDYNKILLLGRLTRDPELRYISSGTAVCEFGLATNYKYSRQGGETKEETCFVDITVWGRSGENCKEYLRKGSSVFVDGRLTFDTWTGPDGQKRSKHRVVADREAREAEEAVREHDGAAHDWSRNSTHDACARAATMSVKHTRPDAARVSIAFAARVEARSGRDGTK